MNSKIALLAIIICWFLFLQTTLATDFEIVSGHPLIQQNTVPPANFNAPVILVSSPKNDTKYPNHFVLLDLIVEGQLQENISSQINKLTYVLDGQSDKSFTRYLFIPVESQFNFSRVIENLTEGNHNLLIQVEVTGTFYKTGDFVTYTFLTDYNTSVNFRVNATPETTNLSSENIIGLSSSPCPSPSPITIYFPSSTPEITIEPTQSASPTSEPKNSINSLPIITGTIIIIIIAVAGTIIYFKRRIKSKVA